MGASSSLGKVDRATIQKAFDAFDTNKDGIRVRMKLPL